ncbi:MAG: hypothetical protein CVU64_07325 [Deltaproteobacteria bacterium HGW-Deltaproteobacteria-21]|nr:MAG: hypothetical protein CVU64_07325 [Deltaproteobacteria bacterium HGW-Deltaproteobacteria-21]
MQLQDFSPGFRRGRNDREGRLFARPCIPHLAAFCNHSIKRLVGIGGAFGAYIGGYLFDKTGSYMQAFGVAVISGGLSCAFMWAAAPRRGALLKKKVLEAKKTTSGTGITR